MRKLVIAVDCDDVLVHTTEYIVTTYNTRYGTQVAMKNAHLSGNADWEAERDEVLKRIHDIQRSEACARIAPLELTKKVVKRLAKRHELHLVSARSEEILDITEKMLEEHFPACFTTIQHVGTERSKGEVCEYLSADVMIDDNAKHLVSAGEAGVRLLIQYGTYPWQNDEEWVENSRHCDDWADIEREVTKLAHE